MDEQQLGLLHVAQAYPSLSVMEKFHEIFYSLKYLASEKLGH